MKISRRQAIGATAAAGLGLALPGTAVAGLGVLLPGQQAETSGVFIHPLPPMPTGPIILDVDAELPYAALLLLMARWPVYWDGNEFSVSETLAEWQDGEWRRRKIGRPLGHFPLGSYRYWLTPGELGTLPSWENRRAVLDDERFRRIIERRIHAFCDYERRVAAVRYDLSWIDWDAEHDRS